MLGLNYTEMFSKEDTEPDLYSFQFGEKNGSFIFDKGNNDDNGLNKKALLIPYQNINISYTLDESNHRINSFTIKDDDGTTYEFDAIESVHANSVIDIGTREELHRINPSGPFANLAKYEGDYYQSWFLTRIITTTGEEIFLTYEDEMIHLDPGLYNPYRDFDPEETINPLYRLLRNQEIEDFATPVVSTKRLSKISSDYFEVEFIANHTREDMNLNEITDETLYPKALNKINVYSKINNDKKIIRQIRFYYSYFDSYDNDGCYPTFFNKDDEPYGWKRLKLDSIQMFNGAELLQPYKFSYIEYSHASSNEKNWLPSRFSYCQDLWGYFCEDNEYETFIPEIYVDEDLTGSDRFSLFELDSGFDEILSGVDRSCSPDELAIGTLEKIELPEGGYIEYEYEPHSFMIGGNPSDVFQGGGLRLKSIMKSPDGTSDNLTVTNYYYEDSQEYTTGKLISMPIYGYLDPVNRDCNGIPGYNTWDEEDFNHFYVRTPFNMNEMSEGTVGYDKVFEVVQENNSIGKTEYIFNNEATHGELNNISYSHFTTATTHYTPSYSDCIFWLTEGKDIPVDVDGLDFGILSYPYPPNSNYSWHRGSLDTQNKYDENENLVESTTYNYDFFYANSQTPEISHGLKVAFLNNNIEPEDLYCSGDFLIEPLMVCSKYDIHANMRSHIQSYTMESFDAQNNHMELQTVNNYNQWGQLSEVITYESDGSEIITRYKYPFDYWDPDNPPVEDPMTIADLKSRAIALMAMNNMAEIPVETIYLRRNSTTDPLMVTGGVVIVFNLEIVNQSQVPLPYQTYIAQFDTPVEFQQGFDGSYIDTGDPDFDFVMDPSYQLKLTIQAYDQKGNIVQYYPENQPVSSKLWGYDNSKPLLQAFNAYDDEIGYAGFELDETSGWNTFGNNAQVVVSSEAKSGEKVFEASNGSGIYQEFYISDGLNEQNGYTATVWVNGPSQAFLTIRINNDPSTNITAYSTDENNWNLLTVELTANDIENYNGQVSFIKVISGNNNSAVSALLDDIRFHPSDASVTSFTYDLAGNLIAVNSTNNQYAYYEYDDLGRLTISRDDDNNIITLQESHIGNPAEFIVDNDLHNGNPVEDEDLMFFPNLKSADEYLIDYGDGNTSGTINEQGYFIHQYQDSGDYDVTLTLQVNGESYSHTRNVVVQETSY